MIDAIYLIRYTALAQARLKAKCWIVDEQGVSRILKIITSVARVWAALCVKKCLGWHFECCA